MKILISISAGRGQAWFDNLTKKEQKAYLAKYPNSKFAAKKPAVKRAGSAPATKKPAVKRAGSAPAAKKARPAGKGTVKPAKTDMKLLEYNFQIEDLQKEASAQKARGIPAVRNGALTRLNAVKALRAAYLKRKQLR